MVFMRMALTGDDATDFNVAMIVEPASDPAADSCAAHAARGAARSLASAPRRLRGHGAHTAGRRAPTAAAPRRRRRAGPYGEPRRGRDRRELDDGASSEGHGRDHDARPRAVRSPRHADHAAQGMRQPRRVRSARHRRRRGLPRQGQGSARDAARVPRAAPVRDLEGDAAGVGEGMGRRARAGPYSRCRRSSTARRSPSR